MTLEESVLERGPREEWRASPERRLKDRSGGEGWHGARALDGTLRTRST
jgi:hypothetical protein